MWGVELVLQWRNIGECKKLIAFEKKKYQWITIPLIMLIQSDSNYTIHQCQIWTTSWLHSYPVRGDKRQFLDMKCIEKKAQADHCRNHRDQNMMLQISKQTGLVYLVAVAISIWNKIHPKQIYLDLAFRNSKEQCATTTRFSVIFNPWWNKKTLFFSSLLLDQKWQNIFRKRVLKGCIYTSMEVWINRSYPSTSWVLTGII